MEAPASIRIDVPVEEFGDAYKGQWVRRRQRVGKPIADQFEGIKGFFTEKKAFEHGCKVLAEIYTDWTLEGDGGPLPKPWGNPDAFVALLDSDLDLSLWILGQIHLKVSQLVQPSKN